MTTYVPLPVTVLSGFPDDACEHEHAGSGAA